MLQYNASCERLTNVCKWGSSEITVFPLCYLSLAVCINYTVLSGFVNLMDLFTFCWLHRQRGVDLSTVRLLILSISLIMDLGKLITSNAYFLLALLVFFQSIFNSVLLQSEVLGLKILNRHTDDLHCCQTPRKTKTGTMKHRSSFTLRFIFLGFLCIESARWVT